MATVRFTPNIQPHVSCPTLDVARGTLREVLENYFLTNVQARGYVLDDQGRLRQHMVIFVDGDQVHDRDNLSDPVATGSVIDVLQALSGG